MKFGEAKQLLAAMAGPSGMCPDDASMLREVQNAVNFLWDRGEWIGTCWWYCVCETEGCLSLPWPCARARKMYTYNGSADLTNQYYMALGGVGTQVKCGVGVTDKFSYLGDRFATFREYDCPFYVWLRAYSNADAGKTVTVSGRDRYGSSVTEDIALSRDLEMACGQIEFASVENFSKPKTLSAIEVWGANASDCNCRVKLAEWGDSQTGPATPKYKRINYAGLQTHCCANKMLVWAKMRPPSIDDDNSDIALDVTAIGWGMAALAAMADRDAKKYTEFLLLAEESLKKEMSADEVTEDQAFDFRPSGYIAPLREG